MAKLPKRFIDRIQKYGKRFQEITRSAEARDVSEADTVTIIKDFLGDVLGYDKYAELTSEHQIRGTFCDLAVHMNGKLSLLLEVKSAGCKLQDNHLRQVVNYAANQGVQWVVLTNAVRWQIYRIEFAQPISFKEVADIDFANANLKSDDVLQKLFVISREGIASSAIEDYYGLISVMNKYTIAQVIQCENILSAIRKEMRKIFPEIKVDEQVILNILQHDIIKRDLLEGAEVKEAQTRIKRGLTKNKKNKAQEERAVEIIENVETLQNVSA